MKYQNAKDAFDELKNFEGKATFKGEDTVIDLFVLLTSDEAASIDIKEFVEHYQATGSFEVEGDNDQDYTLLGVNLGRPAYTNDTDYLLLLLIGG